MSIMLCRGAALIKKNSYLVAIIVSFDTECLHLLTFNVLEPFQYKTIELDLSHINYVIIVAFN